MESLETKFNASLNEVMIQQYEELSIEGPIVLDDEVSIPFVDSQPDASPFQDSQLDTNQLELIVGNTPASNAEITINAESNVEVATIVELVETNTKESTPLKHQPNPPPRNKRSKSFPLREIRDTRATLAVKNARNSLGSVDVKDLKVRSADAIIDPKPKEQNKTEDNNEQKKQENENEIKEVGEKKKLVMTLPFVYRVRGNSLLLSRTFQLPAVINLKYNWRFKWWQHTTTSFLLVRVLRGWTLSSDQPDLCDEIDAMEIIHNKAKFSETLLGKPYIPETYIVDTSNPKLPNINNTGRGLWFVKDSNIDQGKGVTVVACLKDSLDVCIGSGPYIIQREVTSPQLVNGFKMDIRIPAVVVCRPSCLHFYMFGEGVLRLAPLPYNNNSTDLDSQLTNFCRQEHRSGSARHCRKLSSWEMKNCGVWSKMQAVVTDVLNTTFNSSAPPNKRCFEFIGFDFMIDSRLNVWLLEVNRSPSTFKSHFGVGAVLRTAVNQLVEGPVAALAAELMGLQCGDPGRHTQWGSPPVSGPGPLVWFELNSNNRCSDRRCSQAGSQSPMSSRNRPHNVIIE